KEFVLIARSENRTGITPPPRGRLPADQPQSEHLDETLVPFFAQAIQEQDRQREVVGILQISRVLPDIVPGRAHGAIAPVQTAVRQSQAREGRHAEGVAGSGKAAVVLGTLPS